MLRERILAALRTAPAAAEGHLLHGTVWEMDGYEPTTVARKLSESGHDDLVSNAAQWL
jgi:hypothetical protein